MFSNDRRGVETGEADLGGARRPEEFFERAVFQPREQGGEAPEQIGGTGGKRLVFGRCFTELGGRGAEGRREIVLGV